MSHFELSSFYQLLSKGLIFKYIEDEWIYHPLKADNGDRGIGDFSYNFPEKNPLSP